MASENGPGKPRVVRHDTAALRERFEAADLDHDGHLTRAEFNALRAEDYLRRSRAAAAREAADADARPEGRGRFARLLGRKRERAAPDGARRGDDETAAAAAAPPPLPPSVTFDDIDVDGSGDISFDEFVAWQRGEVHERADVLGGTARSAARLALRYTLAPLKIMLTRRGSGMQLSPPSPSSGTRPRRSRSCSRGGGRG